MAKITATQVLDLARKQIGVKATNYRKCKYNTWYYGREVSDSKYHWCNVFIQWLFAQLKASNMLYGKTSNCGQQGLYFKENKRLVTSGYKVGDIVFFHWKNNKSSWIPECYSLDHVGIIEKVNSNGTYTTIEGNTGSSTNGEVMRRTRYAYQISCAGRPNYKAEKKSKIAEDGVWGVETTTRAQEVFGTVVDGKISNQNKLYSTKNTGLLSTTFEWKDKPNKTGSQLVKAIQNKIGAKVTGFMDTDTIKSMQKWLKTPIDGYCGKPSQMIRAFQKWLNKQGGDTI